MTQPNRIVCQAGGNLWFADPNDINGMGTGKCVAAATANAPGFNSNRLFRNWSVDGMSGPAGAQLDPNAATAPLPMTNSLPPSVINGRVPDITAAWPATISQAPLGDCPSQFDVWVDQHPVAAALTVVALFALFGGLK